MSCSSRWRESISSESRPSTCPRTCRADTSPRPHCERRHNAMPTSRRIRFQSPLPADLRPEDVIAIIDTCEQYPLDLSALLTVIGTLPTRRRCWSTGTATANGRCRHARRRATWRHQGDFGNDASRPGRGRDPGNARKHPEAIVRNQWWRQRRFPRGPGCMRTGGGGDRQARSPSVEVFPLPFSSFFGLAAAVKWQYRPRHKPLFCRSTPDCHST